MARISGFVEASFSPWVRWILFKLRVSIKYFVPFRARARSGQGLQNLRFESQTSPPTYLMLINHQQPLEFLAIWWRSHSHLEMPIWRLKREWHTRGTF